MKFALPTDSFVRLLLLFGLGCLSSPQASGQGGPPMFTVKTRPAEIREMAPTLVFTGSIEPWRTIDLSVETSGLVSRIPIEEGQPITQGHLLCQLDDTRATIEIQRNEAAVAGALAEANRTASGYRSELIDESRRKVEAARARFERATDDWERQGPLVAKGVRTESEGKSFESAYLEAEANLRTAEAGLAMLERGYRPEEIAVARAQLAVNRAELAEATRDLNRHTILAPTDCVVVERLKEPGEWVREGEAVARLVVLDPLQVRIEVPQSYLNKVQRGLEATIKVDGFPDRTFRAEVDRIVPRAGEGTRNFPVRMKLANPDGALQSGLFARIQLSLGETRPTSAVPRDAVLIRRDSLVVLVADPIPGDASMSVTAGPPDTPKPNATIREVEVRTGSEIDDLVAVEVLKGGEIKAGDSIVVLGGTRLVSGMPVMTLPDETVSDASATITASPGESR